MAFTTTPVTGTTVPGAAFEHKILFNADNAYPTGGYLLAGAAFGYQSLRGVDALYFATIPVGCAEFVLNPITFKLQFLVAGGTEVAAGTSLVGTSVVLKGYGS